MIAIKNINAIETTTGQVSNDFVRSNGEKSTNHEFISLFNSKTDKKQLIDQSKNEGSDQLTEIELDSEKSQISSISSFIFTVLPFLFINLFNIINFSINILAQNINFTTTHLLTHSLLYHFI